jgi:hypothetical protein
VGGGIMRKCTKKEGKKKDKYEGRKPKTRTVNGNESRKRKER